MFISYHLSSVRLSARYVLTLAIVTALFMLVIPQVITSILSLVSVLPDQLDNSNKWLHDMLEKYKHFHEEHEIK